LESEENNIKENCLTFYEAKAREKGGKKLSIFLFLFSFIKLLSTSKKESLKKT
jgi:hypothetical protein